MATGRRETSNFNGKKIIEARELEGIDIKTLSERSGISRVSISNYENGKQVPSPEYIQRLSEALNVKWGFFSLPSAISENTTFFRSLAATKKSSRLSAVRTLDKMEHIVEAVTDFVDLPPLSLPEFDIPNPEKLSMETIDSYASACRKFWGLGNAPISNLTALLELSGVIVFASTSESDKVDAYSRWDQHKARPYIHLCKNKGCAVRSRFDLAHELGHLLLHRSVSKSDFSYKTNFDLFEKQADRFAGAFLLPEEGFAMDLPKMGLDYLSAIKLKWKVSIASMIMRSEQIEFINREERDLMWIYYTRRGWRGHEPFDDIIESEEPNLLREAIRCLLDNAIISPEDIFSRVPYENKSIVELIQMKELIDSNEQVDYAAKLRQTISDSVSAGQHQAKIIKFQKAG